MRRFAYADPPYLGCAERYYGDKHPDARAFRKPRDPERFALDLVGA